MKKAFTLIEMMISTVLLGLIFTFIYKAIDELKYSNSFFANKFENMEKTTKLIKVLKDDIFLAKNITLKQTNKNQTILTLNKTANTLHNIHIPYVVWKISGNNLLRIESTKEFKLPLNEEKLQNVYIDLVMENIESFKMYKSKDQKTLLSYIKAKKGKKIVFESRFF
jgi:prepilin-type N-terminal cleavage/methylation domain-containing protein